MAGKFALSHRMAPQERRPTAPPSRSARRPCDSGHAFKPGRARSRQRFRRSSRSSTRMLWQHTNQNTFRSRWRQFRQIPNWARNLVQGCGVRVGYLIFVRGIPGTFDRRKPSPRERGMRMIGWRHGLLEGRWMGRENRIDRGSRHGGRRFHHARCYCRWGRPVGSVFNRSFPKW